MTHGECIKICVGLLLCQFTEAHGLFHAVFGEREVRLTGRVHEHVLQKLHVGVEGHLSLRRRELFVGLGGSDLSGLHCGGDTIPQRRRLAVTLRAIEHEHVIQVADLLVVSFRNRRQLLQHPQHLWVARLGILCRGVCDAGCGDERARSERDAAPPSGCAARTVVDSKNPGDAVHEWASCCGQCGLGMGTPKHFKLGERLSKDSGIDGGAHRRVVAAVLTLGADLSR